MKEPIVDPIVGGTPTRVGCYTTARVSGGRVERLERHVARLRRDALRLGLEPPERHEVEALFLVTTREAFGPGEGIVRIEWSREPTDPTEPARLMATARELGPDPNRYRARVSRTVHPGPQERHGAKAVDVAEYTSAREEARHAGVDEVLLFDAAGWLVEGSRSSLLVVDVRGDLLTPDPDLGAVEGVGLSLVREVHPEIRGARLSLADLLEARELLSINAVRGVVPIVELDGRPLAGGEIGPWARRRGAIFFRDGLGEL